MPFLTRDLPPGGRHIDRAVPPVAPPATGAARMRQLLPVGLLVAASSAGVALSPMLGGASSAVADANPAGHDAATFHVAGTIPNADRTPTGTQLDRAAYVVSRDGGRPSATQRASAAVEQSPSRTASSGAGVVAGKHRASGTAVETAPATQTAPKHSAGVISATSTGSSTTSSTTSGASGASGGGVAQPAAVVSDAGSSASATPSTSASQTDVVTSTVNGVGQVVGGVLGTVGGLLGGS